MRNLIVLLLLATLASGAMDQAYMQTVAADGTSAIMKTQDLAVFSSMVSFPALEEACATMSSVQCTVTGQKITITERFASNTGYYTYVRDDGFPFITHTLIITHIPNDVFSASLDRVLMAANASTGGVATPPIDIAADNAELVTVLKLLKVKLDYEVVMPVQPYEAYAGNATGTITGNSASFDLVQVMNASQPIVVRGRELNLGILVLVIGVVVLAGLAYSFFGTSRKESKPPPSLKRKKTK